MFRASLAKSSPWPASYPKPPTDVPHSSKLSKGVNGRAPLLSKPLLGENLIIYLSVSATALSSVLIRTPNGIELQDAEQQYPKLEKLAYDLVLSARKLRTYFQAHTVEVLTNQPRRQVLQKPETSGQLIKWAIELGEFDICYHPRLAEKGQAMADFISELTLPSEIDRPYHGTTLGIYGDTFS
ncbi:unnamed protein product [Prunus armeniaca]